jgi:2-dehydro-3-deoxyphosphogluconate aldolase/(4S)-4-hydroxy-2-oxoglutarate aldolase
MLTNEIFRRICEIGVIPIMRVSAAEAAMRVMGAIFEAGIGTAEITMTVPGVIEAMSDRFGDRMLIGAGTVLDPRNRACVHPGLQRTKVHT